MVLRRFANLLLVTAAAMSAMPAYAVSEPPRSVTVDSAIMQIDEARYLGARLGAGTVLTDSQGRDFALGDVLGKPVILLLSYYNCDGTCQAMNMGLANVLAKVKRFRLGEDYRVLTVSFDARDSARTAADFMTKIGTPESMRRGWRHAVVKNGDVTGFAGEVGFKFFWSDAAKAFMHPNVLIFLTPKGRVARYIYGTRMDARTVELALTDADWDRIASSTAVFNILSGACYSYNYATGKYEPDYAMLIGIGAFLFGLLVLLSLLGSGAFKKYRSKRGKTDEVWSTGLS